MSYRPTFAYAPDLWDAPPETDPADPCPRCGRHLIDADECKCGWCNYESSIPETAEEKRQRGIRFAHVDHRRRGGEG